MKKKKIARNVLAHAVLTILAVVWVIPLFWIILTSFRAQKGAYTSSFFPKAYSLDNYIKLFTDTGILNFPRMFENTLIVAVFSCIISTFFVLSVAYCMSRLKFKLRKTMMNIAMILGLFPAFMAMVAVYYILKAVGLSEGSMIRVALVLVYSASAGIQFYIAKGFFDTIPKTIDEAALIDGATKWQVFTQITIPLSKPIIVYTVLTSFIAPWVDFIFAIVAEELGFVGCVTIILLFAIFVWRGIVISMKAPDMFGSLLAIGVTTLVATQAIINIAVVTASIPTTGMALPFFSYRRNCSVSSTGWSWNFA